MYVVQNVQYVNCTVLPTKNETLKTTYAQLYLRQFLVSCNYFWEKSSVQLPLKSHPLCVTLYNILCYRRWMRLWRQTIFNLIFVLVFAFNWVLWWFTKWSRTEIYQFWPYKEPWMQENGINKFLTIVSKDSFLLGNPVHAISTPLIYVLVYFLSLSGHPVACFCTIVSGTWNHVESREPRPWWCGTWTSRSQGSRGIPVQDDHVLYPAPDRVPPVAEPPGYKEKIL